MASTCQWLVSRVEKSYDPRALSQRAGFHVCWEKGGQHHSADKFLQLDELDDKKHDERDETNDVVGDVFEGVVETESTGHQSNPKSPVLSSTVSHEKDLVHLTANAARDSLCPGDQSLASGAIPVSHASIDKVSVGGGLDGPGRNASKVLEHARAEVAAFGTSGGSSQRGQAQEESHIPPCHGDRVEPCQEGEQGDIAAARGTESQGAIGRQRDHQPADAQGDLRPVRWIQWVSGCMRPRPTRRSSWRRRATWPGS